MTQEVKEKRVQCNYQPENARFHLECDFSKLCPQYYRRRLEKTRAYLKSNCRAKWATSIPMYSLSELAVWCNSSDDDDDDFQSRVTVLSPLQEEKEEQDEDGESAPGESVPEANCSFEFAKRLRRHSVSSSSPLPRSSTQRSVIKEEIPPQSPILFPDQLHRAPYESYLEGTRNRVSECIVIGTIFKHVKLKPDVIVELTRGNFEAKCDKYLGHFINLDDRLVLEDSDESISLKGNIEPRRFVTGVTVALLGSPIENGSQFLVRDICYCEPNAQILYDDDRGNKDEITRLTNDNEMIERPLSNGQPREASANPETKYLLVVSSLGFRPDMGKKSSLTRALQDLIDFIWGGGRYSEDEKSSRVSRILVAGDSLMDSRLPGNDDPSASQNLEPATRLKQSRQVKQYAGSLQSVRHMDDFFAQLCKTIDVDVMPGPLDPSSHLMPQQPFHPCLFPKSRMFATFNLTTNPHRAIYNDSVEILATSGQNIELVSNFSGMHEPIEIMKHHLRWGNCAPNAPDNLYSVPYQDDDPYMIDFIPEIYVAGCQDSYETDYYHYSTPKPAIKKAPLPPTQPDGTKPPPHKNFDTSESINPSTDAGSSSRQARARKSRTLLVTVPRFHETFNCVLINLENLEPHLISFAR